MAIVTQLTLLSIIVSVVVSSQVFQLVGDSVQFNTLHPVPVFNHLSWIFNKSGIVLDYYKKYEDIDPSPDYKDRVLFNNKTYSLTLKNVQKTDSGLYEAKANGKNINTIAQYRLSVLDAVEAPDLTLQESNDTCNITFTCRGHDLSISSSCNKTSCKEKNKTSPTGFILSLYVNGNFITCNQSNPVSWKKNVVEMKTYNQLCTDEALKKKFQNQPRFTWTLYMILTTLLVFVAVIIFFLYRRKKSTGSTVYAVVETSSPSPPPNVMLETVSTMYSVVQKKPQPPSHGKDSQITESQTNASPPNTMLEKPSTLHSVEKKPQSPNQGKDSQSTENQEQIPTSIKVEHTKPETLYASVKTSTNAENEGKMDGTNQL